MPDSNSIVGGRENLTDHHRSLWIRTILATCCGTDRQRQSFSDGYNIFPLAPHSSIQMRENHALGEAVSRILNPPATGGQS